MILARKESQQITPFFVMMKLSRTRNYKVVRKTKTTQTATLRLLSKYARTARSGGLDDCVEINQGKRTRSFLFPWGTPRGDCSLVSKVIRVGFKVKNVKKTASEKGKCGVF